MSHPTSVRAWRVAPEPTELDLREGLVPQDSTLGTTGEIPPINGYGGSRDAVLARMEIMDLVSRFDAGTKKLDDARAALGDQRPRHNAHHGRGTPEPGELHSRTSPSVDGSTAPVTRAPWGPGA